MKILFVASEVNPILKVGGIADVVGSLTKEIKKLGNDVRIFIPLYQSLKKRAEKEFKKIATFSIKINNQEEKVVVWETFLINNQEEKVKVYLFENKNYLSNKGVYLETRDFSHLKRFLFFSKVVLEFLKRDSWSPDIIHCHDWQSGIIPFLLKKEKINKRCIFTIHNLLVQGQWNSKDVAKFLEISDSNLPEKFNVLEQAILNADLITVVSPNYSQEIKKNKYYARGLEKVIKKREKDVIGILNGIDTEFFNPLTDKSIFQNYSVQNIHLKEKNKLFLQEKAGLKKDKDVPLLVIISRLDIQKGVDLIYELVEKIIKKNIQFIFLGTGEEKYEKMLADLNRKYPKKVKAFIEFDAELAQQIYAGGDIFLMPSRFEPCGLSQLIAMRYGNIPLVRKTGGLADTVKNIRIEEKFFGLKKKIKGTGFVFKQFSLEKIFTTTERALRFYSNKNFWKKIQKNAMKEDFSWKRSAQKYLKLYKKLIIKNGKN